MHSQQSIERELEQNPAAWRRAKLLFDKNPAAGLKELRLLADQGSLLSMLEIGRAHARGLGTPIDVVEAEKWLRRVADAGSVRGYYYLGRLFLRIKRYEDAKLALSFSAVRGFAPALHDLGKIYYLGLGVEKNLAKAKQNLQQAADAGNVFAKRLLARVMIESAPDFWTKSRGMILIIAAFRDLVYVALTQGLKSERLIE